MKRAIAIADRLSDAALKLLVAINILFLLSFLAMLFLATAEARAETVACTGRDLTVEMRKEMPAEYERIEAEAGKTLNGQGLLWKLEKDGKTPSFLFGTMHMTDPRVTELTPAAQAAFDAAKTVVIETTDILDQTKMMETLAKRPELMMFTDATTLPSLLSPEDAAVLEKGLSERGIPLAAVTKMKPWMLIAMVALPACELARKTSGAQVLDARIANDAKAAGKTLTGLESAADQLGAMASLPMEFHMQGLLDTLKLGDRMDDVMETMIVLYERGDVAAIMPMVEAVTRETGADIAGYAEFEQTMVNARNVTMAKNAGPILAEGGAFIAVGALHLPGTEGLVEQFRRAGYTVTPAGS
ncbi:TraB/GumN family protein [Arvimicrobium flavum]|uniref:TraB/GumN family protein n=1 Tax=Arvimicrobium flavum TaxID=3393320 RepID=UPI00237BB76F|nr:TraB/GumN family protein [Mesorhizobium shangrilense]